ncbi:cell division protein ZapA [Plasticicumulans lactativorans]|uniref:Cell division protein ZapA n=1 Tax=Plasticicumulans lactativorans TaxID=1133106 RepID=A0A4R2L7R7_9GAMM|nr:cell division protein ZapA [Plasticicumulans lactativorans]TCO81387.1 cell division protein ZapA [Plasticicumulans lactativorans]
MSEASTLITVRLLGSEYRVACPPDEIDELHAAAAYYDERLHEIRDGGRVTGPERVAVMAGLNLCYELLRLRRDSEATTELATIGLERLLHQVEASLSKISEAPL